MAKYRVARREIVRQPSKKIILRVIAVVIIERATDFQFCKIVIVVVVVKTDDNAKAVRLVLDAHITMRDPEWCRLQRDSLLIWRRPRLERPPIRRTAKERAALNDV